MKSAFTSSALSVIRTRPQGAEWFVAIHKPATVERFVLNSYSTGSIVSDLDVSHLDSATHLEHGTSSARAGMTGVLYDSGGSNIGEFRIREDWDGGKLKIAEAGSGLINWRLGSIVSVIDQYRPWLKHPRYDTDASQWRMDYDIAYDGQLNLWGPYANLGPPIVVLPTSGTSANPIWVVDFFSGSTVDIQSFIDGASWVFPDGQTLACPINSEVKMTFNGASPGGSYFSLAVESNNGTSHIGRRLIFAVNDISELHKIQSVNITGGIESGGYQAQLVTYGKPTGELIESFYPHLDNSEIVVFERARYGSNKMSFGGNYPHRENIIFRGWIQNKDIIVNPYSSTMLMNAQTIDGILNQAESYDIFLANYQAGGSDWTEMQGLCLDGVAQFALKWRSTVGDICDWQPAGLLATTEQVLYQSLPRSPLFTQLRQNYGEKGILGYFASDMQSGLFGHYNEQVNGASNNVPLIASINKEDRRDAVTISTPTRDVNAQTKLYAVTSDIPYGAESPGVVKGYFGGERIYQAGLLTDSQDRLITWTGNFRAWQNSRFPNVNIPLAHNERIDAVPQSRVRMSLAASENARGITWSNKDFYTKETNITYDANIGFPLIDITVEEVVNGIGGSSITFPTIDDIVPIPTNPPAPGVITTPVTPPVTSTIGDGFGTVYVMTIDYLGRTRDFSAASPVWANITGAAAGDQLNDFILDPWSPTTTGYLVTDTAVYKSTNLTDDNPTFNPVLLMSSLVSSTSSLSVNCRRIIASINLQNYIAIAFSTTKSGPSYGTWCAYSYDGGSSWATSQIGSDVPNRLGFNGAMDYVPHLVNGQVVLYCAWGRDTRRQLHKSTNGGATWSLLQGPGTLGLGNDDPPGACVCHCPYNGNEDGQIVYAGWAVRSGNGVIRSTDGGSSYDILSFPSSLDGLSFRRTAIETFTHNNQLVYAFTGGSGDSSRFVYSTDGGDNWTEIVNVSGNAYATGGFPTNQDQFYAVTENSSSGSNGILVSTDGGATWTTKTGNWDTVFGANSLDDYTSYRDGVIVPLWTE